MFEVQAFPAASLRRRVLIAVLAVVAAGLVMYLMLRPVKPVPAHLIPEPRRKRGKAGLNSPFSILN